MAARRRPFRRADDGPAWLPQLLLAASLLVIGAPAAVAVGPAGAAQQDTFDPCDPAHADVLCPQAEAGGAACVAAPLVVLGPTTQAVSLASVAAGPTDGRQQVTSASVDETVQVGGLQIQLDGARASCTADPETTLASKDPWACGDARAGQVDSGASVGVASGGIRFWTLETWTCTGGAGAPGFDGSDTVGYSSTARLLYFFVHRHDGLSPGHGTATALPGDSGHMVLGEHQAGQAADCSTSTRVGQRLSAQTEAGPVTVLIGVVATQACV